MAAVLIFFSLLEGGFVLFGFNPAIKTEDPFVGFASNIPLFVRSPESGEEESMTTAPYKKDYFNQQSFFREKPADTFRIFCLGGSTTYGRPYDDKTSFAGWLRDLLPEADRNKNWEVINAGGISYASYRVTHLMNELINYQPDLFVVYTGHNEFLEQRTYSGIREIPQFIRSTVSLLARTRTWSAMQMALESLKPDKKSRGEIHDRLASEVDAILDRSAGPNRYTRDDSLQENILQHYRISLERMVELARTANARIMFVTPASNLKDCSPFKSEHTPGLDQATRQLTEQMLLQGKNAIHLANWNEALALLKKAVSLDPRHAEMQYRLGRTLLALNRYAEAEAALRLARDEDVCPLRALTPMRDIMIDIAKQQHVGLVDYVDLLEVGTQGEYGHPIAGEEFFLDHVHPTIEGHKILALGVIQAMADQGLVKLEADWGMKTIAAVSERIEKKIDRNVNGQALAKLSRVLLWAGKNEDATRLARQALDIAGDNKQVFIAANGTLVSAYQRQDDQEKALKSLYKAIEYAPDSTELHLRLGQALMNPPFLKLEEAAANLLFVCQKMPYYYAAHQLFGLVMAKRGRPRVAHASLTEALRLNPNNTTTQSILSRIRPQLGKSPQDRKIPAILLETHPSLAPRKLMQVRRDQESGRNVIDGIAVEFYENGRVKSLTDFDQGAPVGHEIKWDNSGRILSNGKHPLRKVVNTKSVD